MKPKTLAYKKEILKTKTSRTSLTEEREFQKRGGQKYEKFESVKKGLSESVKVCAEFWDPVSIYRG